MYIDKKKLICNYPANFIYSTKIIKYDGTSIKQISTQEEFNFVLDVTNLCFNHVRMEISNNNLRIGTFNFHIPPKDYFKINKKYMYNILLFNDDWNLDNWKLNKEDFTEIKKRRIY